MKNKVLPVKKGTVLMTAQPFVYVLKSKLRGERCENCFKANSSLLRCSVCRFAYYCDRECQKQSWIDHKGECSNIRRVAPKILPDAARIMARIILKLKRGGDQEEGKISDTRSRKFKDLMSHYSDLKQDPKRVEHFTSLNMVLAEFIGEDNLPNTAELIGIYGRMCVNSFNILDPEMHSIGTGIYLAPSIIDHSCDPCAVAVFEGIQLHIRAIKDIPHLDWSKIFISYNELLNNTADRQADLQAGYYFSCDCPKCADIKDDKLTRCIMCTNENCRAAIPVDFEDDYEMQYKCPSCEQHVKEDLFQQYKEVAEFTQDQLTEMKEVAYLDVCKVCLQKQRNLFHPLDLLHVKIVDLAFECCIEMQQWEESVDYGRELIPAYRKYYGEFHPLFGILFLKLGKILLYLQQTEESHEDLVNAEAVIRVTHGTLHSLYRSELMPLLQQAELELRAKQS